MFMYYDIDPGFEGTGYNHMCNPHSHWSYWEAFAIRQNNGQTQKICYPNSLAEVPMLIFSLEHPPGSKVLHDTLEKQFTQ